MTGNLKRAIRNRRDAQQATLPNERAFTLVELLVVLALTAIVTAIIYKALPAQNKVYVVQDQVVAMQQQLRAAMNVMVRDIRMAGYNPKRKSDSTCNYQPDPSTSPPPVSPGIWLAKADSICFSQDTNGVVDLNGDGDTDDPDEQNRPDGYCKDSNENITYKIGMDSAGKPCLQRKGSQSGNFQCIGENIEVLNLVYFDQNGPPPLPTPVATSKLPDVRSIQVTLIARTDRADKDYKNTTVYKNQQGKILLSAPGDGYRRRLLTTTVQCYNMGL